MDSIRPRAVPKAAGLLPADGPSHLLARISDPGSAAPAPDATILRQHGVLNVTLPKVPEKEKVRKTIDVKVED